MLLSALQTNQAAASTHARHLQATATIPVISLDVAKKTAVIPTASPLLTLNDMLCAVEPFSPTGLKGMLMPTAAELQTAGVDATAASGKAISCTPRPAVRNFNHGGVAFKPVVIPVVFHCEWQCCCQFC
jgi:hypothetical protein